MKTQLILSALALAASAVAQNIVLPDNHYLMESATQSSSSGDTTHWRNSAGRFQIIYEASHFLGKAGVPGPIVITHLKFRGEDGEPNLGGQIYSGVIVQLGSTSLTSSTMVTTFGSPTGGGPGTPGSNRDPATTTLGPSGTVASLVVAPSTGACPNNYFIDIDLTAIGAAFVFDPTSAQPNLLIDVTMPSAPSNAAPLALIPTQDTVAHGAGIRGKTVSTATFAALTGTTDTTPAVVGLEFSGPGGHPIVYPAQNEYIGASCGGSASTFYQGFNNGQLFDLTGLTLLPDNPTTPTVYTVTAAAPPVDLTKLNALPNSTAEDAVVTHALGFTFNYPGGSTTTIKPSTNGFVWLDSTMTGSPFIATVSDLLGAGATAYRARLLPFWCDINAGRNIGTHPNSGMHVMTDTSGGAGNAVCYTTWYNVGLFRTPSGATIGGHAVYTFQCVLYEATGVVEFRYGPMMPYTSYWGTTAPHYGVITGFTLGRIGITPSVDPQSRDLSVETPFTTSIEGATGNASINAVSTPIGSGVHYNGRLFGGQTLTYNVANIPAGTIIAMVNLDLGASQPGWQIPGLTAPGCMISTSLSPLVLGHELWVAPAASMTGTVPLVVPHGWEGVVITAQAIGLDVFGGPFLVPWASNTIKHLAGLD